jgi:hypothetical protein
LSTCISMMSTSCMSCVSDKGLPRARPHKGIAALGSKRCEECACFVELLIWSLHLIDPAAQ